MKKTISEYNENDFLIADYVFFSAKDDFHIILSNYLENSYLDIEKIKLIKLSNQNFFKNLLIFHEEKFVEIESIITHFEFKQKVLMF
jgi:hypothetical protein